jgi:MFS transporter, DHA2 family, multidrug resistance protein
VPLTAASCSGLPPQMSNQAAALFNVARNLGGGIGVSLSQTLLQQHGQFQSDGRNARHQRASLSVSLISGNRK